MNRYLAIRSIMESPILDERKWAKVPSIPADAWILDMEDSAPPARKEEARDRVIEYLGKPEYFDGRLAIPRPNHLSTPWGRADMDALGRAGVTCIMLPKVHAPEDLHEARRILNAAGADPDIFVNVESARGIFNVYSIAQVDKVVALMFGPGDLSLDMGMPMYEPDGQLNAGLIYPQMRIITAAATFGLATTNFAVLPDIRDLGEVRRRVEKGRRLGFSSGVAFYPPHIDIINEVFSPSSEEIEHARETVSIMEAARQAGNPAAVRPNGEAVLIHDYEKARKVLARAETQRV
jgi:citrate lyase beta subunit